MQPKPLTPMSCDDFRSPLDDARAEIVKLKLAVASLTKSNQMKTDVRVLDLQLRSRNYREFLKQRDLLIQFRQQYPNQ